MALASTIPLFEVEPDLLRFVAPEDREPASRVLVPVRALEVGDFDVVAALEEAGAFGAVLVDGMLLQTLRIGDHVGLRLLGPGDVLSLPDTPPSILVVDSVCRVIASGRLALLGDEVLRAARQWPRIIAGLHARGGELADRIATQLIICQLPRVNDRLLSLLWLLAESWGTVTTLGTLLPVSLTHEALGGLIGARRPTVTLALGELTDAGSILRQDGGWLLLRRPTAPAEESTPRIEAPRLLEHEVPSGWAANKPLEPVNELTYAALRETVLALRAQHVRTAGQVSDRLRRVAETRAQVAERRRRTAPFIKRSRAPSS